jgi:hypothetical protein
MRCRRLGVERDLEARFWCRAAAQTGTGTSRGNQVLADGAEDCKSPRVCLSQVAAAARRTAGQWRGGQLGRVRRRRTWKVGRRKGGAVRYCRAAG